ncbi:MAG: hypothetical protein E6J91_14705 [Deltaproteobacteria bacterium]|nr:MAG: hypothetical protein E6J91_14705 [Deltaproteobacteria bacterium]
MGYSPQEKDIEQLLVRGSIYVRVVAVPGDQSSFLIEGHGWHVVYYGRTDDDDAFRFLGTAEYRLMDDGAPRQSSESRTRPPPSVPPVNGRAICRENTSGVCLKSPPVRWFSRRVFRDWQLIYVDSTVPAR